MPWFPAKKLRKQAKVLLLLLLLSCAAWLTYVHLSLVRPGRALRQRLGYGRDGEKLVEVTEGHGVWGARSTPRAEDSSESREEEQVAENQGADMLLGRAGRPPHPSLTQQVPPWQEEYKGQVNLHVFEDWCGGAVGHLRKNLHFPLFPHTRTTLRKLAVSPKWKNYGLRIFGFLHPARDGDVQFSVASDDNSELWLSPDESPAGAQLVAFVGKTGSEWTAPGEFTKFSSQVSKPRRLMASRKYYFELLHKQDDRGSDHVEVGWRAFLPGLKFEVIDSAHLSLYTDESALKMDQVAHIPQSPASHVALLQPPAEPRADMLRPDPRDTFFLTPRVEPSSLEGVLEPCTYAPTYVVKDFPIARYQGLQFVYLTSVYPNDHTRLTHMETDNKCFYRESPLYLERFGFYKYMKMDRPEGEDAEGEVQRRAFLFLSPEDFLDDEDDQDPRDSEDSPTQAPGPVGEAEARPSSAPSPRGASASPATPPPAPPRRSRALSWAPRPPPPPPPRPDRPARPRAPKVYVTRIRPQAPAPPRPPRPPWPAFPGVFLPRAPARPPPPWAPVSRGRRAPASGEPRRPTPPPRRPPAAPASPSPSPPPSPSPSAPSSLPGLWRAPGEEAEAEEDAEEEEKAAEKAEKARRGGPGPGWREEAIDWQRTFSVGALDFELLRSDWNDLRCNVSGNLQLPEAEAVDVVAQYMERLHARRPGRFSLERIVNVEKRRDSARGSRFLLELELLERGAGRRRLSEFVFLRLPGARAADPDDADEDDPGDGEAPSPDPEPAPDPAPAAASAAASPSARPELCRPLRLAWRQDVMVHFVVPVKNQARWVLQFLADMAALQARTGDARFGVVLVDFDSDDMDVERALRAARLPWYRYLRRAGNFERSAGLQAGVDAVEDASSIVFLCDLHIHFPPNILDCIRKHCVEGKLAFAPVVMRLGCGSSPQDPLGYWEVNGFGLFGIYKSDLDRVGGMNTEEFRDQWGGEDWELLDRVLQAGLEVERLRLRHFYHHFHSKRGINSRPGRKVTGLGRNDNTAVGPLPCTQLIQYRLWFESQHPIWFPEPARSDFRAPLIPGLFHTFITTFSSAQLQALQGTVEARSGGGIGEHLHWSAATAALLRSPGTKRELTQLGALGGGGGYPWDGKSVKCSSGWVELPAGLPWLALHLRLPHPTRLTLEGFFHTKHVSQGSNRSDEMGVPSPPSWRPHGQSHRARLPGPQTQTGDQDRVEWYLRWSPGHPGWWLRGGVLEPAVSTPAAGLSSSFSDLHQAPQNPLHHVSQLPPSGPEDFLNRSIIKPYRPSSTNSLRPPHQISSDPHQAVRSPHQIPSDLLIRSPDPWVVPQHPSSRKAPLSHSPLRPALPDPAHEALLQR
ncbi:N-acetyl-beta-glucosaminyl-glycoprotein 4-beta-N-acetylgalactosaminyltransferase 1 [Suncus etruscus]|uniref:N-acetyl-beta-glucosaminyl-glycoprotein 4-beta-N-acetylgalactosaminyltransferase 1 n=1 Tax=Suncus etruscus TaxID=109475 RepID=UPI00210F8C15|nr:N-acetyl-beta-glucosaminyl-glycoprotein 4-beta-N-acetylgalactosaminyltransferase 1 [Suncus etruscus]